MAIMAARDTNSIFILNKVAMRKRGNVECSRR
jgi:hypothetical protein